MHESSTTSASSKPSSDGKATASAHGESDLGTSGASEPENGPILDTSGMSEEKARAVELAEAAREDLHGQDSFAASLFMGDCLWERIHPFPQIDASDAERETAFLDQVRAVLDQHVDADEVDETGELPDAAIAALQEIGAFGIKIPQKYGGLGLTQTTYVRQALLVGSHCASLTAYLSAHQSIGVPNPLLLFGNEEQRQRLLPGLAAGELSAFALTEENAGSDPARMETVAVPDGDDYVIDGTKLWCTNGSRAKWIVVMAKTPPKVVRGRERQQISAFVVDAESPGVTVDHRCRFMGHRALYNATMTFTGVRVPKANLIGGEGAGLRIALTTLNTGRLTLPAAATGVAKRCLGIVRKWASTREQWGAPIGQHGAIADKIARIAASVLAMEAMTILTAGLVDRKVGDIRVEAAMCKLWCSERNWEIVNETMQVRGGRGYETMQSLRDRDAPGSADPVERFLRDARITTIFEGSSEILRGMAIAREGMDHHAKLGKDVLNTRNDLVTRAWAAMKAGVFYAPWYVSRWLPAVPDGLGGVDPEIADHVRWTASTSKKLARKLFHQMMRHGMGLERRQLLIGRFVDVATELFALSAACSFAQHKIATGTQRDQVVPLLTYLRRDAARRIDLSFRAVGRNNDESSHALADQVLDGRFEWLEGGTSDAR